MIPIETTGLLGGSTTRSAVRIASRTPGAGDGLVHAGHDEPARGYRRLQPDPPLLEVHGPLAARSVVQDDVGLDRGVGHRQQGQATGRQPPPVGEPGRDLREGEPLPEPQRPGHVRTHVAVPEPEPLRTHSVCGELALDVVRLVRAPPALGLVDAAAQRVEDGVEVGTDAQPEEGDVVSGVADDGDVGALELRGAVDVGEQATQEAGAPDPAGEGGDVHGRESVTVRSGARRLPAATDGVRPTSGSPTPSPRRSGPEIQAIRPKFA